MLHTFSKKIFMHTILKVFRKVTLFFRLISVSFSYVNFIALRINELARLSVHGQTRRQHGVYHSLRSVTTYTHIANPCNGRSYCRYGIIQCTFVVCVCVCVYSRLFLFSRLKKSSGTREVK
jgi:hypothetical protein